MMEAVDKVDSANLTIDEILHPTGWILVGFIMEPSTGLGRWRNFRIPNYRLMEELIDACRTMTTDEILALPDVVERIETYNEQSEKFQEMVKKYTRVEGNVIISDLRKEAPTYWISVCILNRIFPHGLYLEKAARVVPQQ